MKKIVTLLLILVSIFIVYEVTKEETFTIVGKEVETSVRIESNKLLNPTYKRATLGLMYVDIVNVDGENIDASEIKVGAKIKAELKPLALLSNPPGLSAWKITLLD